MKSQIGLKPYCITCKFFAKCEEVPVVDNKEELAEFDRLLNDGEFMDNSIENSSGDLEENNCSIPTSTPESSENQNNNHTPNSARIDKILKACPPLKIAVAFVEASIPKAELEKLKTIPNPPAIHHHVMNISDYEVLIGSTVFMEELLRDRLNLNFLNKMFNLMGGELLSAVLFDKIIELYSKNPELLAKEFADITTLYKGDSK